MVWDRLTQWQTDAEELLSRTLYALGLFCASKPLLVIYACFIFIAAVSYPAAVYLDRSINGPAGYEPVTFWSQGPSHTAPILEQEAFAEAFGDFNKAYLRIDQIFFGLGSSIESSAEAAEAWPYGVLERELLLQVASLQEAVSMFVVADRNLKLQDVCFQPFNDNRCLVNSPLEFWASNSTQLQTERRIRQVLSQRNFNSSFGTPLSLRSIFGGATFNQTTGEINFATSIVITYFSEIESQSAQANSEHFWNAFWRSPIAFKFRKTSAPVDVRYFVYKFRQNALHEDFAELWLLGLAYVLVFLYFSLSLNNVSGVDLVKSKAGLGLAAVATVILSLLMSLGICSILGVQITLVPWEVLPFLVIILGVDNTSKITKAVVSTSYDLPVKERVGLGLSAAGPAMTRRLIVELLLLSTGRMLYIPILQEFCFFVFVAAVMDYLLHLTLFTTVLSIDIRRLELSDLQDNRILSTMRANSSTNLTAMVRNATFTNISATFQQTTTTASLVPPIAKQIENSTAKESILSDSPTKKTNGPIVLTCIILILLFCVLLLGSFSFTHASMFAWDRSMSNAADDFWAIVNTSSDELYVEIQPPVHLTLLPPSRPVPTPRVSQSQSADSANTDVVSEEDANWAGQGMRPLPHFTTWPYWILLLSTWFPLMLPYLHQAGPLVVIFTTAMATSCFILTIILMAVTWPSLVASLRRQRAAAVAPDWAVGPFRETVLAGHEDEVESFDGSGSYVVSAGLDRTVQVWEVATGNRLHILSGFSAAIWQVRLHEDTVIVACADGSLSFHSASSGELLHSLKAAPNTTGSERCRGSGDVIRRSYSVNDGLASFCKLAPKSPLLSPQSSPSNHHHIMPSFGGLLPPLVPLESRSSPPINCLSDNETVAPAHDCGITALAIDADALVLYTGSDDRTVKGWSLKTGAPYFTLEGHRAGVTQLHVHRPFLISGCADGSIRLYALPPAHGAGAVDASAIAVVPAPVCRLSLYGHVAAITALLVIEHDCVGPRLVSGSQDGQIRVWDLSREFNTGACLATLMCHTNAVIALVSDAPTHTLVSAALDETVVLWDMHTFRRTHRRSTPASTAIAIRDSVLVMGEVGASRVAPAANSAVETFYSSQHDHQIHHQHDQSAGTTRKFKLEHSTPASSSSSSSFHFTELAEDNVNSSSNISDGVSPPTLSAPQWRTRWGTPRQAGLSLFDIRTRTMLRRSMPLRVRGNGGVDEILHSLCFCGDVLVASCGDSLAVLHLSRSRVEKKTS